MGQRGWQQQLEQMLQRDRVFLRHALYSADGQHLAGAEISAALLHSLQAQQHACPQVRVLQPEAAPAIQPPHVLQVPLLLCLHGPDDVLQALLVLHMDMGYFLRLYRDMDLGSSGMLHLVAQDGSVVAALAGGGLLAQPCSSFPQWRACRSALENSIWRWVQVICVWLNSIALPMCL